jgi:hypothetical protein
MIDVGFSAASSLLIFVCILSPAVMHFNVISLAALVAADP